MSRYKISSEEIGILDHIDLNIMVSPLEIVSDKPFFINWFNKKNLEDSKFPNLEAAIAHPFIFPEKFIIELKQKFNEVRQKGYSNLVSTRYNDDGSVVTAYFSLIKIDYNDVESVIWIEQKKSEEQLNTLSSVILRYINQPIIVFDQTGKDIFLSPEAYKMFNNKKTEYQILEIINQISSENSPTTLEDLLSSKNYYKTFYIKDENDKKKYFTFEVNSTLNPSDGSKIYISVFTNITNIINHEKVLETKNEIESILANIHQGIFKIDEELNIVGHYSKYLEEILETKTIRGTNVVNLIFKNSSLTDHKPAINALKSIGDNDWEYDLNAHHLPKKLVYKAKSKEKYLTIDWVPLFTDASFLVCVRDDTDLVYLEKKASKKEEASKKILNIINMGREKFSTGFEEVEDLITGIQKITQNSGIENKENPILRRVIRDLHTIKGNSKTLQLKNISTLTHTAEQEIIDFQNTKKPTPFNVNKFNSLILQMVEELNEYNFLLKGIFTNIKHENKHEDAIKTIKSIIDKEIKGKNSLSINKSIKSILNEVFKLEFDTLDSVLELELTALKKYARQLSKQTPNTNWLNKVWIPKTKCKIIRNVFTHILRNSITHGIEDPETRKKNGKKPTGEIFFDAAYATDSMTIYFRDDGRGLNVKELQSLIPDKKMSNSELAELVFQSGVSTSLDVSDLSGRGVGMDAIRDFVSKEGGSISIDLFENNNSKQEFIPFQFVIILPFNIPELILQDQDTDLKVQSK